MSFTEPSSFSHNGISQHPTMKLSSSIEAPLPVKLEDFQRLVETYQTFAPIDSQTFILPVVHLAWLVAVRSYAGENTFYVTGDYATGCCSVYGTRIKGSSAIELNADDSVESVLKQLFTAMSPKKPSNTCNGTNLGRPEYNASITYGSSGKDEAVVNLSSVCTARTLLLQVIVLILADKSSLEHRAFHGRGVAYSSGLE
jgi:hypothetical protein